MLLGDFNDILSQEEKKGGALVSLRKCQIFKQRINDFNLMDIGAIGPGYTWRGPRNNGFQRLFERLDRGLSNHMWRLLFCEALLEVLPRVEFSDHYPLLVSLYGQNLISLQKPFHFECAWLSHENYVETLNNAWNKREPLVSKLENLKSTLSVWRKNIFGEIHKKKQSILARIGGIQNQFYWGNHNPFLINLEKSLHEEIGVVLYQEELSWFQKSRAQWLHDGDQDTRYYHLKTISRRRRNKISMLRDGNGNWLEDEQQIRSLVNEFYINLFSDDDRDDRWSVSPLSFPILDQQHYDSLGVDVLAEKVKMALFGMKLWKAPGPDGLPAGFFQNS